ncbi:unnamed protein product [Rhizophagus irregularis]|nr:unnamed protein product [Rhizophagus irregularis]
MSTEHQDLNIRKRGGSIKKSWVWEWFESDETGAICQVEIVSGQLCNKHYKNGSSTGNLINNLTNKHQITEGVKRQDFVVPINQQIEVTPHRESHQIELRNLLVNWIISDMQPLIVVQSESFRKLIKELDPGFTIPDIKLIKQIIHKAYNTTLPLIREFLNINSISVCLTTDMWTAKNRQGAKRIIDFFLRPKQSERLEEIQKKSQFQVDLDAEIENANDVVVVIEEVEILETEETNSKNNNQRQNKIDLNKPLETEDMLKKVKESLYNAICYYWKFLPEDYLISTILDPRIKYMGVRSNEEEILREKYEEYKEDFLPTPIASQPTSPTLSETTFSTIIYKPTLFAIFEQDQPRVADEVTENISKVNNIHPN